MMGKSQLFTTIFIALISGWLIGLVMDLVTVTNAKLKDKLDFEMIEVDVTAYSPSPHITDSTPFEMSSGKIANPQDLEQLKYVAISRDIRREYNLQWGDSIWLEFQVEDLMGPNQQKTVDIFMRNLQLARKFGRQKRSIMILRRVNSPP